ncbi:flagellar hook-length control protein FliK [Clostridium hydrogenum]|uniref:flagellar hook-length control protein FliK n=1 Tax=Clostridium hydrogenum TaxID=2855764 RepID=UPI001F1F1DB5|nr:flagellar hook-length control protein FliK [Clostridium hydrogenum]
MSTVNSLKTFDLGNTQSTPSNSKGISSSDKSNSFDTYLNDYSNNNPVNNKASYKDDSRRQDSSKGEKNYDSSKNVDSSVSKSNVNDSKSQKVASAKDDSDDNDKIKELDKDVDNIKKYADDNGIDLEKMMSLILNAMNGKQMDMNELKTQMNNLKIPESVQKDVMDLVSKIQDILDGKVNASMLLNQKFNDANEHSKLISSIIDVLKSKLKEGSTVTNTNESSTVVSSKSSLNQMQTNEVSNNLNKQMNSNDQNNDFSNDSKDNTDANDAGYTSYSPEDNLEENKTNLKQDSKLNVSTSKDNGDEFLNNLLSNNKNDNQFSKVTAFMNQFSSVNTNAASVSGEVPTINKATFVQDLVQSVKYMDLNNMKELTVKINPKELGEVIIKLTVENNQMKASIQTANKETYSLIHSSLADINKELNNQNIKIQDFSVNIYDDTTYFGGQNSKQGNESGNQSDKQKNNSASYQGVTEIDDEENYNDANNSNVDILV